MKCEQRLLHAGSEWSVRSRRSDNGKDRAGWDTSGYKGIGLGAAARMVEHALDCQVQHGSSRAEATGEVFFFFGQSGGPDLLEGRQGR